jgi:A/G-specific adenine glycosylase
MDKFQAQQIVLFQEKILSWYALHQRDLPWRKTRNPYTILISEIMLQQTQVNRVIPKFMAWLETFPTILDLANAPISEVLALWSGLGYNRRALNLKKTAQIISEKHNGQFPQTEKELLELPGIGHYTARAVLCFAFDKQVAVVDTNVRKVILTQFLNNPTNGLRLGETQPKQESISDKHITEIAEKLLPQGKAYDWNQALMDYASSVLKKEKIPVPKQSAFKNSRRYYRGQVLKVLLEKKKVAIKDLGKLIKKDYSLNDANWLEGLVDELIKEGFLVKKNTILSLQ